jgi:hypothetical protein
VLTLAVAETVGAAFDSARARASGSLSSMCPDDSPTVQAAIETLTPRESEAATPPAATAPVLPSFDHRTLTPLRPSLKRAQGGDELEITGSRTTGSLVAAPAGGVELDNVVCLVPTQTTLAETPARIVGGDSALRANSAPGTDTIIRPTPAGIAIVQSRRDASAPTSFTWRLGLPSGKRLLVLRNGDVAIADREEGRRRAVAVLSASSSLGSQEDSPPALLQASGRDTLTASAPENAEAVVVTITTNRVRQQAAPPAPVPSYPLIAIKGNISTEAANAACAFAQAQPEGHRLMLFNFGQAHFEGGEFGAGRPPFFHSNDEVLDALIAAANRYRSADCHQPGTSATIAYGVTNYRLSETGTSTGGEFASMSSRLARRAGAEQLRVAQALRESLDPEDDTAVAGDIEPGWDQSAAGVRAGKALVRGANTGELTYFNFGSAGHCPPYSGGNPGCGNWGWNTLGTISQARGAVALPQMYHAFHAKQWNRVRKRWNRRHLSDPTICSSNPSVPECYTFAGATSEPKECGSNFTPRQSWKLLRDAVPAGALGPELIYYNPGLVNC